MTVLVLNGYDLKCKKYSNHLLIEKTELNNENEKEIRRYRQPITELTGVILEDYVYIAPAAVIMLIEENIPIIRIHNNELIGITHSFAGSGTVITRRAQFLAFLGPKGMYLAKMFVYSGLLNKANLLLSYGKNRSDEIKENLKGLATEIRDIGQQVKEMTEERTIDESRMYLMALEARGAKIYLQGIISILPEQYNFNNRNRRPPRDPINAALSYGYAILNAQTLLAVIGSGLDPYGGFLHVDRSGRTSLSIDIAEEFRQSVVDRVVFTKAIRNEFDVTKDFSYEGATVLLNQAGKRKLVEGIEERLELQVEDKAGKVKMKGLILRQARRIIHYLLDKKDYYHPYIMDW